LRILLPLIILPTLLYISLAWPALLYGMFYYALSSGREFLNEVKNSVSLLFRDSLDYLGVNIVLSLEVHIFTLAVLAVFRALRPGKGIKAEIEDAGSLPLNPSSYLSLALLKHSIMMAYDLKTILSLRKYGKSRPHRRVRLDESYLLGSLMIGVIASTILLLTYEVNYVLFWNVFLLYLLVIIVFMMALGRVSILDEAAGKSLGLWHRGNSLIATYGTGELVEMRIGERTAILALSLSTGMCGVLTTLGSVLLRAPLTFTLVPITFDMLSVLTALMEFQGLRSIPRMFWDMKMLGMSILTMSLVISWGVYLSGVVYYISKILELSISTNMIVTMVSCMWMIIAITSSALLRNLSPTKRVALLGALLTLIPPLLLFL